MPKLNIERIPLEKVLEALFRNVYRKTECSMADYKGYSSWCADLPGVYSVPFSDEFSDIVKKNKVFIDKIGCVLFNMDIFDGTTIDTTRYDQAHKTGTNGIKTSEEVLNDLKIKIQAEKNEVDSLLKRLGVESSSAQAKSGETVAKSLQPSSATKVEAESNNRFFKRNTDITQDKRFTKSSTPGILYEASSYSFIEDDVLLAFGFVPKQWIRSKNGIENTVIIKELSGLDNSNQSSSSVSKP